VSLGNFVDGQIVGSLTSIWWAVKFQPAIDTAPRPTRLDAGAEERRSQPPSVTTVDHDAERGTRSNPYHLIVERLTRAGMAWLSTCEALLFKSDDKYRKRDRLYLHTVKVAFIFI
jgi:hypothetical protein